MDYITHVSYFLTFLLYNLPTEIYVTRTISPMYTPGLAMT